jgi:hypothetical protein
VAFGDDGVECEADVCIEGTVSQGETFYADLSDIQLNF